jgi:hypothetical protein
LVSWFIICEGLPRVEAANFAELEFLLQVAQLTLWKMWKPIYPKTKKTEKVETST